jgi:solute carrier family 35, member E3
MRRPQARPTPRALLARMLDHDQAGTFSLLEKIVLLTANVFIATAVILGNKAVFRTLNFNFPITLTAIHYTCVWCCTELCRVFGLYHQKPWSELPIGKEFLAIAVLTAIAVPLNNMSLRANALGTYQLLKLLVTPAIVLCSYVFTGEWISLKRSLVLFFVCCSIGWSTAHDVELRWYGLILGLLFVPIAAAYKVYNKEVMLQYKCDTLSFFNRVYPLTIPMTVALAIFLDPPGISSFVFDEKSIALLVMSGLGAFLVTVSSTSVVVLFSPLTHQVLGLLKISLSILFGMFMFGEAVSLSQFFGAVAATSGIGYYTLITQKERRDLKPNKQRAENIKLSCV